MWKRMLVAARANRLLTLNYGSNGMQTINDTVLNWRNVLPCGKWDSSVDDRSMM
jgi:hypothetical protein